MKRQCTENVMSRKLFGRGYSTTTGKWLSNEWFGALVRAQEVNKNRGYQNVAHAGRGPHVWALQSFRATRRAGPCSGGSGLLPDLSTRPRKVATPKLFEMTYDIVGDSAL